MFISLSILPFYLILLHGVTSADLSDNKRVLRRHAQVTRTFNVNHPPIVENIDEIPVTVLYDDTEVIKGRNKNGRQADKKNQNNPPSIVLHSVDGVNDYEGELNLKPRARSIKIPVFDDTKVQENPSTDSENRTAIRKRKRVQKVRKVKVDKSKLDVYVSESEMAGNKEAQKEKAAATSQGSLRGTQHFEPRKGVRDPVIPIVESESYVFSHSGNFHYSYEGGDGTKAYERGELKTSNGGSGSAVEGNFSYKDKDGMDFSLSYTADENGYRPVGAHLPTPPPIPPAIARALAYLATKPTPEPITERIKTRKTFQ